jgi:hypothetical protein
VNCIHLDQVAGPVADSGELELLVPYDRSSAMTDELINFSKRLGIMKFPDQDI